MDNIIDIYVDINNRDNVWGLINNNKKHSKPELIHFENYQAMINYVNSYFNKENVNFHNVDYSCIEYFSHNGRPNLNYIEIKYYEYKNNSFSVERIKLPKEYEELFVNIMKVNKGLSSNEKLDSKYHHDIDVYEERDRNKKLYNNIILTMNDFLAFAGDKIKIIKEKKIVVKGLKIVAISALVGGLLSGGYHLMVNHNNYSEYLVQKNPINSIQDIGIYARKSHFGKIIEQLSEENYNEVSENDLKEVLDFIKNIEDSNYDNNASFNSFNYSDYFKYKIGDNTNFTEAKDLLGKIEEYYNKCFYEENGKWVINRNNTTRYVEFVSSLSFLYDTYHSTKPPELVKINTQDPTSKFATIDQIRVYDSFSPILKYIILSQLKGIQLRSNYGDLKLPSYYFNEVDKYGIISQINEKLSLLRQELKDEIRNSNNNKIV